MFKNMTTKAWVALGVALAYLITLIVLTFAKPAVMFFGLLSLVIGGFCGYFIRDRKNDGK